MRRARFLGETRSEPGFQLRHLGWCPAMVRSGQGSVFGELYEIDQEILKELDRLEKHPDWYKREVIRLEGGMEAISYLMEIAEVDTKPVIESGNWRRREERS